MTFTPYVRIHTIWRRYSTVDHDMLLFATFLSIFKVRHRSKLLLIDGTLYCLLEVLFREQFIKRDSLCFTPNYSKWDIYLHIPCANKQFHTHNFRLLTMSCIIPVAYISSYHLATIFIGLWRNVNIPVTPNALSVFKRPCYTLPRRLKKHILVRIDLRERHWPITHPR